MDKLPFEAPTMEIVEFESADIITTSGQPEPPPPM